MFSYNYTYLILDIVFLVIWLVFFFFRKDVRKEMLVVSLLFGIAGLIAQPIYVIDWWKPLNITGTLVGFEDFLFGFVIGGLASTIYEEAFKKRIKVRKKNRLFSRRKNVNNLLVGFLLAFSFFFCFFVLHFNTLVSSIIGLSVPTLYIWIRRKDLIVDSLVSGFCLVFLAFVVYSIVELLTPGWVQEFWHFKNVPNLIILNVPIDDIVWYFFAGAFIGPFYEFWQEKKLRDA